MSSSNAETVWFVTGTSRGIGLEITTQLLQSPGNVVLAACRSPFKANALQALTASASGRLHILRLDVDDAQSIKDAASEATQIVGEKGIDYLINNAGINPGGFDTAFGFKVADLTAVFQTNVIGPALLAQAFLPLVEESGKKTIVNVSSTLGSVGTDLGQTFASYSVAKAGLNMLTSKQAKERPDVTAIAMCPGHLQTDLGGPNATTPVSVGVSGVLKVVSGLTRGDSGSFFNYQGDRVQW
ncbi:hypothetical protein GSI_05744 [Ganoderma sinense ZZ0214-1]|uniref:Uncharacterized protein n=1 Tax=Ganoderma sinense ZZ0214-1 TaxID=1077348 RepID=A0A2G8SBS3_9APHY|nr:hypothetical protein GSI_05744 [Ganoderma sinense ZZ0214-1]